MGTMALDTMPLDAMPPQVLVGLVTLTVVVLSRLRSRPARTGRLITGPIIVLLVGAFVLVPWLGVPTGDALATVGVAVVDLALTVGLGVARGITVDVGADATGLVRYRYTLVTVALWVVSVALRFELAHVGSQLGASPAVTEGSVLLALGVALLTQNLVVVRAATRVRRRARVSATPSVEAFKP